MHRLRADGVIFLRIMHFKCQRGQLGGICLALRKQRLFFRVERLQFFMQLCGVDFK